MTVHTASERLVTIELSPSEDSSEETLTPLVNAALECCGCAPWSSVELEVFESGRGAFVFASPVRVLLPEFLLRLAE